MRFGPMIALLIVAGAGYGAWRWIESQPTPAEQGAGPAGGGRGGGRGRFAQQRGGVTPVSVEPVRLETVPIVREGIGNMQARQTVTVRAQVDGPLLSVDFIEGQMVKKGDVLARIDPAQPRAALDQALAKKAQDEANLANARVDLQRYRALAASNAGPKQQADQQAAMVAQLAAQVKADEAAVATATTTLSYTTIVSPLDGRAGLRQVDPGNIVRASDATGIVTLTQITPIDAVFTLPQRDLDLVKAAQAKGAVVVDVMGQGGGAPVATGALTALDNQIDASTGTIRLKATFANADQMLWPGQFVSVRVTVDRLAEARVVPATAIRRGPNGPFVYVLEGEDRVAARPVAVATQDETRAALSKGVEAGEKVVTVGFARLTPGARVSVSADVAAPDGGASGAREASTRAPAAAGGEGRAAPRDPDGSRGERGERGGRRRGDGQGRGRRGQEPGQTVGAPQPAEGAPAASASSAPAAGATPP